MLITYATALEHHHCIRWRGHGPLIAERNACHEEGPAVPSPAQVCQCVQIEQLANRRSPSGQQDGMKHPFLVHGCCHVIHQHINARSRFHIQKYDLRMHSRAGLSAAMAANCFSHSQRVISTPCLSPGQLWLAASNDSLVAVSRLRYVET